MTDLFEELTRYAGKAQRLQADIDAAGMGDPLKRENAELRAEIDRLRIEMHRIAEGRRGQRERAERAEADNERLRKIERAARAAVETQKATGDVRLTLLADVLDDD